MYVYTLTHTHTCAKGVYLEKKTSSNHGKQMVLPLTSTCLQDRSLPSFSSLSLLVTLPSLLPGLYLKIRGPSSHVVVEFAKVIPRKLNGNAKTRRVSEHGLQMKIRCTKRRILSSFFFSFLSALPFTREFRSERCTIGNVWFYGVIQRLGTDKSGCLRGSLRVFGAKEDRSKESSVRG